jgi:hypothetical protein
MEDFTKPAVAAITIVVAWLHGRYSRKVRLKIGSGEIEVEAPTLAEVKSLLREAEEYERRNQRMVIHEP